MHGGAGYAARAEGTAHEFGMALRHAEGQSSSGVPGFDLGLPLLEHIGSARLGRQRRGEALLVKAPAPPRNVLVVDGIGHAKVAIRREQLRLDAAHDTALVDQVLATQAHEVAPIGTLGRCGEAKQKCGVEVIDEAPIGGRGGMMEFIDHDVVEGIARESLEVARPTQRLDRGKDDVGLRLTLVAVVEAKARGRAYAPEGRQRLRENLFTMGDEEHAPERLVLAVKGSKPGLAKAGGHHHQPGAVAGSASRLERGERLLLDGVRHRRRGRRLDLDIHCCTLSRGQGFGDGFARQGLPRRHRQDRAPCPIRRHPGRVEQYGLRVPEEFLEGTAHPRHALAVAPLAHPVIPLDALLEGRGREVRTPHIGHMLARFVEQQVGLGVKARAPGLEDAQGHLLGVQRLQINEFIEGIGVGDAQVVTREEAQPSASRKQFFEVRMHARNAASLHEGDRNVDLVGFCNVLFKPWQERVRATSGEHHLARVARRGEGSG